MCHLQPWWEWQFIRLVTPSLTSQSEPSRVSADMCTGREGEGYSHLTRGQVDEQSRWGSNYVSVQHQDKLIILYALFKHPFISTAFRTLNYKPHTITNSPFVQHPHQWQRNFQFKAEDSSQLLLVVQSDTESQPGLVLLSGFEIIEKCHTIKFYLLKHFSDPIF